MTETQWNSFQKFRDAFFTQCRLWEQSISSISTELLQLQREAAQKDGVPYYPLETPIVYNTSLDKITKKNDIKLIIVCDNPGKDEQLSKNRCYLVGQAGKLANTFFKQTPSLGIDFNSNTIILNKTPLHTAKTKEITYLLKHASSTTALILSNLFIDSMKWMAQNTISLLTELNKESELSSSLATKLWLVGYSELKHNGIFEYYKKILINDVQKNPILIPYISVYQHFSMNCFTKDLNKHCLVPNQNLITLGILHRKEILGF